MKSGQILKKESPLERAWSAIGLLGWSITWNERCDEPEDDETVRISLDALASALIDWKQLDMASAPLDEVLAELGVKDEMIETAAHLIELVGRASYSGGMSKADVERAEGLREELVEALDELLTRLDEEEKREDTDG